MKLGIMQPYFFPYIGYFQLMANVDKFVIYDNIKFTKKGWIQRNRILQNNKDEYISLTIKKDSDSLNINQRFLSDNFLKENEKTMRKIEGAYSKAPFFKDTFPLIEDILAINNNNLFDYLFQSISKLNNFLNIKVELIKSSSLGINIEEFKGQEKVLNICTHLGANTYINSIGGIELYDRSEFKKRGITLLFIKSKEFTYQQFENAFIPWLSIIDVLMFNDKEKVHQILINGFSYE